MLFRIVINLLKKIPYITTRLYSILTYQMKKSAVHKKLTVTDKLKTNSSVRFQSKRATLQIFFFEHK